MLLLRFVALIPAAALPVALVALVARAVRVALAAVAVMMTVVVTVVLTRVVDAAHRLDGWETPSCVCVSLSVDDIIQVRRPDTDVFHFV